MKYNRAWTYDEPLHVKLDIVASCERQKVLQLRVSFWANTASNSYIHWVSVSWRNCLN